MRCNFTATDTVYSLNTAAHNHTIRGFLEIVKYDRIVVLCYLSDRVDEAFITACLYLKDHMDEMTNLDADMVNISAPHLTSRKKK